MRRHSGVRAWYAALRDGMSLSGTSVYISLSHTHTHARFCLLPKSFRKPPANTRAAQAHVCNFTFSLPICNDATSSTTFQSRITLPHPRCSHTKIKTLFKFPKRAMNTTAFELCQRARALCTGTNLRTAALVRSQIRASPSPSGRVLTSVLPSLFHALVAIVISNNQ